MDEVPTSSTYQLKTKPPTREFSQNLQHHLWDRESGFNRRNLRYLPASAYEQEIHKCITPNLTIQNVDKPLGYMRKFTPDGRMLLSFSHDQRSLEVYSYRGVGSVAELLQRQHGECITAADHSLESLRIRQQVYQRIFQLRYNIRLAPDTFARCHLNREFSIFMEDGRYVLLGALAMTSELPRYEHILQYPDLCDDCELFAYTFFLVDLSDGSVSDMLKYKHDCIILSHNHGVSVHGRSIAILSKYRQCIDLLELVRGKMVRLNTIGPLCCDLDRVLILRVPEIRNESFPRFTAQPTLSYLKQRIITYLYRCIWQTQSVDVRRHQLRLFYKNFKTYERMVMTKLQLISADHLLIRYEERPPQIPGESNFRDEKNEFKLYVFYDVSSERVLKIYPKNSTELLYLLSTFCDHFRNVRSIQTQRPSSSPSNNAYFRAAFYGAIACIPGGKAEAAARLNPTLPISSQSFATTQYLDYSLFNYDDRLISALERPKLSTLDPIRFSDRNTNITKFRLFLESLSGGVGGAGNGPVASNRELVAFIFHPFEPFIISIQKLSTRYVVNFHLYNDATVVKP